jgi:DNA-binding XRE family transcriptional regulator
MCSIFGHYTEPRGVRYMPRDSRTVQDHRKPAGGRLTYNHAGHSVCRVSEDPPDDWTRRERQRLGRRLQAAREERDLTQEQVFNAVPMNRAYYQRIEAGEANPSLDILLRISRTIGVRLDFCDEPPPRSTY